MANEIKLELYIFRIREKKDDKYLILDKFFGDNDFLDFFKKYIEINKKDFMINETQKKSLQFQDGNIRINSAKRMISGIIESGDYGVESRIVNRKTKKEKYKKEVDDLDIKPFYFLVLAEKGRNLGLIVLQRLGGYGINTIFTNQFAEHFKKEFEDYLVEFSPFVSKALANKFIDEGSIKELTLRRYNLPSDVIDKLGLRNHEEDVLSIELKITAKQRHSLPFNNKVKKFVENPNAKLFDIKEMESLGFDGTHKSSIKANVENNTRTIDLSDTLQIRPYYDINSEVKKEISGHPKFDSIDNIAKQLIGNLILEFYS
ncbi:MAG TPA: hypothetical protein PLS73_10710 [Saprospiraceae bacterium]|nr:hypothetical protein [Saprospiraceae bacterium]